MQKNNVNIIVFDEDQSFVTEQSRVNYNTNRRPSTYDGFTGSQAQSIINIQIGQLNQKISALQEKAMKIQQALKQNNKISSQTDIGSSTNNSYPTNSAQIEQLLRVVELKIQVVVQQTKKIIQKMTSQFDKKINKSTSQKNHEINSITKIQTHCRDTIAKVQKNYQDQLNIIRNEHLQLQKRLIQKVEDLESSYKKKLRDFQSKQQQYIATIQHLENKLKLSSKSKKMIEVTQDKPTSSVRTQTAENMSILSSQQHFASSNGLPANDTSKRRTKIFQGRGSNKSISPNNTNNQILSPIKPQNSMKSQTRSLAKDNPSEAQKMSKYPQHPANNNYLFDPKAISNQGTLPNQNLQNKPIVRFTTNPIEVPKNDIVQAKKSSPDASSKQFFRDPPKIHWERFEDFNQHQNSGEEQDVFFYPDHNRKSQPRSVFDNSHNQSNSMHSPFDLN